MFKFKYTYNKQIHWKEIQCDTEEIAITQAANLYSRFFVEVFIYNPINEKIGRVYKEFFPYDLSRNL